jgi:ketosteroid isomerase-like protein
MSRQNVETVGRAIDALGEGIPKPFIALCDPQFETQLVGVVGVPVHYDGAEGIREFVTDMEESWTSFGFEVEDVRDLGDRVLVLGERGRGRARGVDVASRRAMVIGFEGGAITSLRFFTEPGEALEVVGLRE